MRLIYTFILLSVLAMAGTAKCLSGKTGIQSKTVADYIAAKGCAK